VAVAHRAGAEIQDIEFVQFHPTALRLDGAPSFLLSEALRGEGARLLNTEGERFMERYHALGELAPRDVVARAIVAEMGRLGTGHVWLDLTHRGPGFVRGRFPRIYETCLRYGLDLERHAAPVAPAAHYAMGGVAADLEGRTSLRRLYAAGEVACTGVHGANRLASNSLLEGVVFGARAGRAMREASAPSWSRFREEAGHQTAAVNERTAQIAWECCGIIRHADGLRCAIRELEGDESNVATVARLIARSALAREESRGAHFRTDFPNKQPEFARHSILIGESPVTFRGHARDVG
jgi:L-aspartate oxidase